MRVALYFSKCTPSLVSGYRITSFIGIGGKKCKVELFETLKVRHFIQNLGCD